MNLGGHYSSHYTLSPLHPTSGVVAIPRVWSSFLTEKDLYVLCKTEAALRFKETDSLFPEASLQSTNVTFELN